MNQFMLKIHLESVLGVKSAPNNIVADNASILNTKTTTLDLIWNLNSPIMKFSSLSISLTGPCNIGGRVD